MLADPQSVTLAAVAKSVRRTNQDAFKSEYLFRDSAEQLKLVIGHSYEGKGTDGLRFERHLVRLDWNEFALGVPTPLVSAYTVFRMKEGTDPTDLVNAGKALRDYLTNTVIGDVVAWQS
ncbi:MAG: putative coat protein [Leviviridae sp.]|nr:MAG: putative coat protein [Leviviridae sp.]